MVSVVGEIVQFVDGVTTERNRHCHNLRPRRDRWQLGIPYNADPLDAAGNPNRATRREKTRNGQTTAYGSMPAYGRSFRRKKSAAAPPTVPQMLVACRPCSKKTEFRRTGS